MLSTRTDKKALICPSVLAADFADLKTSLSKVEQEADWLHCDIMDGNFVPNISFGMPVMEALKHATKLPLDVHLMTSEPERWIEPLAKIGVDSLVFHQEVAPHGHRLIQQIKDAGCSAGIALCPATPISTLEEYLPYVDLILIMTVNPGFGGQRFIDTMLDKIKRTRALIDSSGRAIHLQVDGGISANTIAKVAEAGADTFVAGSACFGSDNPAQEIQKMRELANAVCN